MSSDHKLNIEKIKKALNIISAVFVFSIAFVILFNVFYPANDSDISNEKKFFKHLISDHNVNDVSFEIIKFNIVPVKYVEKTSDFVFTGSVELGSFILILSSVMIFSNNKRDKISYAEIFLFTDGFKPIQLRPPKYSA